MRRNRMIKDLVEAGLTHEELKGASLRELRALWQAMKNH
jgi:hypothetical protein